MNERRCWWTGSGQDECPHDCPHNTDHRACLRSRYPERFRPRDIRPLREIFPTANRHRLSPCPCCGNPTPKRADGQHVCNNWPAHRRTEDRFYRELFKGNKTPSLSW